MSLNNKNKKKNKKNNTRFTLKCQTYGNFNILQFR